VDELILLAIIVVLAIVSIPICIIVLFVRTSDLQQQIKRLERQVKEGAASAQRIVVQPDATFTAAVPVTREAPPPASKPVAPPPPAARPPADVPQAEEPAKTPVAAMAVATSGDETVSAPISGSQDQPIVFRPDRMAALIAWVRVNWIYLISAASLGLAGIFFVQYGMERGLLPPGLRVCAAIAFGAALIAAGEWVRRRYGDEGETTTIHLPSVFSGAGLVSIFAAILAARHLYGLIGSEVAFVGLLATGGLALVLGWFYGPLLAAVGLIGAAIAPFIVAGGSSATPVLYGYFAVLTATGLGVDAIRRWAWVSVLALVLGYAGSFLSFTAGAEAPGWIAVMILLALMAAVIPPLAVIPRHPGPNVLQSLLRLSAGAWPGFPTRLAAGAALVSSVGLLLGDGIAVGGLLVPLALALLALAYLFWAEKAEGLADLALLPAAGFLFWLVMQGIDGGTAIRAFQAQAIALRPPETGGPWTATLLVGLATAISGVAALRALRREGPFADLLFGLMAVLVAPVTVAVLELLWSPAPVIGLPFWAGHIVALAALMTGLATRFAAVDEGAMHRCAYAVLSALSLIALALFLMTTATALTLALAVLVVAAAGLDRRFNLPEMGLFQQIGVAVLTWRLLLDPGLEFALDGPLTAVALAFAGSLAALVAARWMIGDRPRPVTAAVLESAGAGLAAIFANVLLTRWLIPEVQAGLPLSHWQSTLSALPWLVLMLVQLYRAEAGGWLRRLRLVLAGVAGVVAGIGLFTSATALNPLRSPGPEYLAGLVQGPPLIDTLFLAYALPGLILLIARARMPTLAPALRSLGLGVGAALLTLYAALEIRRWWQGDWLGAPGVTQAELYTYTLALMLLGAALLYQAIRQRSDGLRRIAMGVIALTVAKVFLIDAAGLTGLTRVASFLGLGLSLAGLALLNRWAGQAAARPD
jgi:uncharacterized membrane protein